jgi:hypothetical protein
MSKENNQLILYSTPQGNVKVEVFYEGETFWLTQKAMSSLFAVSVPAISKHLKNIFETKELDENSVVSKMEITASDKFSATLQLSHPERQRKSNHAGSKVESRKRI